MKTEEMIALAVRQATEETAREAEVLASSLPVEKVPLAPLVKPKVEQQTPIQEDVVGKEPVREADASPVQTNSPEDTQANPQEMAQVVDHSNWKDGVPMGNRKIASKGLVFVFGFLGLFLVWALLFPISSAVVSAGKIVSLGANKLIQHPAGGVVKKILVFEGEYVEKGEVLFVLDPSVSQAELSRLTARRKLLGALQTRLNSEQGSGDFDGNSDTVAQDGNVLATAQLRLGNEKDLVVEKPIREEPNRILEEQRREYDAGRKRLSAQLDAASSLAESLKDQRSGLHARLAGAEKLLNYSEMEIQKIRPLVADGYVAKSRLWEIDKTRLEQVTSVGNLEAEVDAFTQRIAEAEAQISQLTQADQEQRSEELTKVMGELAEIKDQIKAAQTAVTSTELKAPATGTITKLTANTVGGVVVPGSVVAEIVPKDAGLVAEFRVALHKINAVKVGQKARVVITAFNRRTYDPIEGEVIYVSADSEIDTMTGETFFVARARLNADADKNNGLGEIQAGMQTEVFALSEPRVFMSYVLQPIFDSFNRAFRETN